MTTPSQLGARGREDIVRGTVTPPPRTVVVSSSHVPTPVAWRSLRHVSEWLASEHGTAVTVARFGVTTCRSSGTPIGNDRASWGCHRESRSESSPRRGCRCRTAHAQPDARQAQARLAHAPGHAARVRTRAGSGHSANDGGRARRGGRLGALGLRGASGRAPAGHGLLDLSGDPSRPVATARSTLVSSRQRTWSSRSPSTRPQQSTASASGATAFASHRSAPRSPPRATALGFVPSMSLARRRSSCSSGAGRATRGLTA